MYIYRALNDCDIALDFKNKGIFNKEIIEQETYNTYYLIQLTNNPDIESSKELFNALMPINASVNKGMIYSAANTKQRVLERNLINTLECNFDNPDSFMYLENYFNNIFSTINAHLEKGSKLNTPWISFTKDFEKAFRYYLKQEKTHNIVVVESDIDGIVDDNLLALDLSTYEEREKIRRCLITKYGSITKEGCIAFNYAEESSEILYYNHVPNSKVKANLTQLETDLLLNDMIDLDKLINCGSAMPFLIKNYLGAEVLKLENSGIYEFYQDVYVKNKVLSSLIDKYNSSEKDLILLKRYILSLVNNIDNPSLIKHSQKRLVLPEDYKY